ncbi:ALG6 [Dirofilaria immitis]|nr:ALG6 [Dirofilaria immitis]
MEKAAFSSCCEVSGADDGMRCDRSEERIISTRNQASFLVLLCFAITVQISLSLGSYSGHATPPIYGDYEAQRHWMEITYHLPVNQWYVNGSDNDLNYWGLDYPPLTAYHSWFLGTIANKINRSWIDLHVSRGIETESHKIFMRITVLATYWIVYVSSLLLSIAQLLCYGCVSIPDYWPWIMATFS